MVSFPRVPCETIMLLRRNRRGNCSRPMGVALVCAIQSRWVVGEPWIFLFMVSVTIDCVSKSIVSPLCSQPGERAREREKEGERKSDVRGAETGWESKGKRGREGERENPKVRNVQLTPPYWVWFYGLSSIQSSWNRDTLYDGPPVEGELLG